MGTAADLIERRETITEIDAEPFLQLPMNERLEGTWRVFRPDGRPAAPVLYALDLERLVVGSGQCIGWGRACGMQVVEMRTNGQLVLNSDTCANFRPTHTAPWLVSFVTGLNDGLGAAPYSNIRRGEAFLPFVDAFIGTDLSGRAEKKAARMAGFRFAQLAGTEVVPAWLEKQGRDEAAERLRELSPLTSLRDVRRCRDVLSSMTGYPHQALGNAHYTTLNATAYVDGGRFAANRDVVMRAHRAGETAAKTCVSVMETASRHEARVDWPTLSDLAIPALAEVVALSAHPILGQTQPDVAAAMNAAA